MLEAARVAATEDAREDARPESADLTTTYLILWYFMDRGIFSKIFEVE